MAKRTKMYAAFVKRSIGKRLPPPDVQRASSVGPDGKSTRTVNDDAMPRYKPKEGYKDAPGGTRYGGNYLYDKNTGRRKV